MPPTAVPAVGLPVESGRRKTSVYRRILLKSVMPAAAFMVMIGLQACVDAGGAPVATRSPGGDIPVAIDHTLSGVAYKTFAAPLEAMRSAALTGLGELEFAVTADDSANFGRKIEASANERRIAIELEALSPNATRMQVTAERTTGIFRDRATATEIIVRTATVLVGRQHASAGH